MRRRPLLILAMAALALMVAAPPVAAGEVGSTGKVGEYQVYDDSSNADAICRYLANGDLDRITVRNPFVHSSNYLSNPTQKQWVGWRVVIERRSGGGDWGVWSRSTWAKKQATQEMIADFSDRTFDVPSTNHQWRIRIVIKWYQPGTSTKAIGTVNYRYDWYKRRKAQTVGDDFQPMYCIPEY